MYQHKREPLTEDEANRLASCCETPEEKIVVFTLLDTGLRVQEFAHIAKDRIDWQAHRIVIFGKGGPYGRMSKRRVVPMSPRVKAVLEPYVSLHGGVNLGVRKVQRIVTKLANRAGISRAASPHVLRHTFAVMSLKKGISITALQKILGHANLQTTMVYLNVAPEDALREYREKW